jgi:hypothetical protein
MTATPKWDVELTVRHAIPAPDVVNVVDDLLNVLSPYAAADAAGPATITVRLIVPAMTVSAATAQATGIVTRAFTTIGRAPQVLAIQAEARASDPFV